MHNEQNAVLDCSETTVKYPTFAERLRPRNFDELLIADSVIEKFKKMNNNFAESSFVRYI